MLRLFLNTALGDTQAHIHPFMVVAQRQKERKRGYCKGEQVNRPAEIDSHRVILLAKAVAFYADRRSV
jgi:hypothetical protein